MSPPLALLTFVTLLHAIIHTCAVASFTKCGFTAELNYAPWTSIFDTDLPTLFPKSEEALSDIISKARANSCRVRPVGATHSVSGIVAHKAEENVVTVNLADVVPSGWQIDLDEERGVVRAPAGASLFDLQAVIRPKGYLLPTSTASPLFALGGVYLTPSTHGASIKEDRLTTLLMGVRAILANGTIVEEFGDDAMRKWRGSMGFLGIVTGVEVRVRKDTGLFAVRDKFRVEPWTLERHTELFSNSLSGFDSAQFYWDPLADDLLARKIDLDGDSSFDFRATKAKFDELREEFAGIQRKSFESHEQKVIDAAVKSGVAPNFKALKVSMLTIQRGIDDSNESPRDGYTYGTSATFNNQIECHFPCPDDCVADGTLFVLMDVTRTYIQRVSKEDRRFPYVPMSIRFFTVAADDVFVLNYLRKGRHVAMEVTVPRDAEDRDEPFSKYLRDIENIWNDLSMERNDRPVLFHIQKEWGHDTIPGLPEPYPYISQSTADRFFTPEQRAEFLDIANHYDPEGVFRAGELARMLGVSEVLFDPRRSSKEESQGANTGCRAFQNPECISSCCCTSFFNCFFDLNECTVSGLAAGRRCKTGCACASGRCWLGICAPTFVRSEVKTEL